MFGNNGTTVTVEPLPSGKWAVRAGRGGMSSRHNQKRTAVKKARKKARSLSAKLEILDQNMNVVETADHR